VQEEFEKNWAEGTFPGWPVNILPILQFIYYFLAHRFILSLVIFKVNVD